MKKCIKFLSIEQFRNVCTNINRTYNYVGLDESGEPIYDHSLPKPVITFHGTCKLHGTNAGVSYNSIEGMWFQSRENIITPQKDNAGFAVFGESNKSIFEALFQEIIKKENIDTENNTITIYGEWCGANIQKGVGIANLDKSFFIFAVKITPHTESDEELKLKPSYFVSHDYLDSPEVRIYNIEKFQTFNIEIDFNNPQLKQNELSNLTIQVENECPVAKAFGFEKTVGEGIVWSCNVNNVRYYFKTKGEKHSSSKVKTLASVDVDKLNNIQEFVDYVVTESRFNQALENIFPNNEELDIKKLGEVIRWIVNDVLKEEMDTMKENGLEPKEINSKISVKARQMFLEKYNFK